MNIAGISANAQVAAVSGADAVVMTDEVGPAEMLPAPKSNVPMTMEGLMFMQQKLQGILSPLFRSKGKVTGSMGSTTWCSTIRPTSPSLTR